jgi:hypothetical protein
MTKRWTFFVLFLTPLACVALACTSPSTVPDVPKETEEDLPNGPPLFKEMTPACGVTWSYRNGQEANNLAILESLGGGVGLIDFDRDGLLDVFVVGGGYFSKNAEEFTAFEKKGKFAQKDGKKVRTADPPEIRGYPCKLYRNLGNWKFEDVTDQVGLKDFPWFYTHGVAVGDYDCDGWPDLIVTGWGRVALLHNEPVDPQDSTKGRKFVDVTEKAGLTGITWASSAGWADLDGDGYPELYICQYADWSWNNDPPCQYDGVTDDVCPPKQFSGLRHKLFYNNRNGTFQDVSETVPLLNAKGKGQHGTGLRPGGKDASKGLGVLLIDVNGDGKPDIYVANDTVDKFLYINHSTPGKLQFEEQALYAGVAKDDRANANGSMGLDAADYDGCGRPSLWVTNYENELHSLYHNDCKLDLVRFNYRTQAAGIGVIGQKFVGWGTGFLDVDHHGWEDIVAVNGHAIHKPKGATLKQRPILFRNKGNGKFVKWMQQGGDYFQIEHRSRGLALGDLDNDGRIDLVVSNVNEPVAILRNVAETDGNHWLGIELRGKDHADVVGARIVLEADGRKQTRFAKGGGSYASANDRRHVFGLAKAEKIDGLRVIWTDGKEQQWNGLTVDRYYRLTQGKADAEALPVGGKK